MYVFLDDERFPSQVNWDRYFPAIPHSKWLIVRDVEHFKKVIDAYLPEIKHIAFDHDLAKEHYPWNGGVVDDGKTGMDAAKYLVEQCMNRNIPLPSFSAHSMNPAGRQNIISYLENYRRVSQ
jgi:hypothetical protein